MLTPKEQTDNIKLHVQNNVAELENKLTCKVDDLEQYSRRSCLRTSGIKESVDENMFLKGYPLEAKTAPLQPIPTT